MKAYTAFMASRAFVLAPVLLALALPAAAEVRVQVTGTSVELAATAAPLAEVLDRLSRQTGMKVVYEGPAPRQLVTLTLRGRTPAQTVLALLEGQGVNFALVTDPSGASVRTLLVTGSASSSGGGAPARTAGRAPSRSPFGVPPGAAPDAEPPFEEGQEEPADEPVNSGVPPGVEGVEQPPAPPEGNAPVMVGQPTSNPPAVVNQGPVAPPQQFPVSPFAPRPIAPVPATPAAPVPNPAPVPPGQSPPQ